MVAKTLGTVAGHIVVTVKDQNNAVYNGATVSAVVTGSGLVLGASSKPATTVAGTKRADSVVLTGNVAYFSVSADGTAGSSSIAISLTDPVSGVTTALKTVSLTFAGTSAAKVTATQNLSVAKAGAQLGANPNANYPPATAYDNGGVVGNGATLTTNNGGNGGTVAVTLAVLDSNGVAVIAPGAIKVVSDATGVISSGSCVEYTTAGYTNQYECSVTAAANATSGQTANVTFGALGADGVTYVYSAPVKFAVGGKIASNTMSFDASTYAPGAPVVVTITSKDSAGNAAYDQDASLLDATAKATTALGGSAALPGNAATTVIGGASVIKGNYAPTFATDFGLSGTTGTLTTTTVVQALSAKATVAGGDSSSLAYDAASAATDAANNAYEEAQNATQAASDALAAVKALAVQVKSLIALVNKIKAKLKA